MSRRKNREKKAKRRENFIAMFIAFIMIGSVFGVMFYGFSSGSSKTKYNGYTFTATDNSYFTKINGKEARFYFLPEQIDDIELSENGKNLIKNSMLMAITFEPSDPNIQYIELLRFELGELLANEQTTKTFLAGITEESDQYQLPIMNCNNASRLQPIIYFRTGNKTEIIENNNCLIFQASYNNDLLRLRDKLFYILTGITE